MSERRALGHLRGGPHRREAYECRLSSGEYYLVAVDPSQQGEWLEPVYLSAHQAGATRFSLTEGDVKTQDFRLPSR